MNEISQLLNIYEQQRAFLIGAKDLFVDSDLGTVDLVYHEALDKMDAQFGKLPAIREDMKSSLEIVSTASQYLFPPLLITLNCSSSSLRLSNRTSSRLQPTPIIKLSWYLPSSQLFSCRYPSSLHILA